MKIHLPLAMALLAALAVPAFADPSPTPTPPAAGPVQTTIRVPVDFEQGSSGHRVNGVRPFQAAAKIGPALDVRGWQFEPAWVLLKYPAGAWKGGACLRVSKLFWEPDGRRVGVRLMVDGSYYGGSDFTAQFGPVLDLNGLLRLGFLGGIGSKPNDHFMGMTTVGVDLVSWSKLLVKSKPTPGPFHDVNY